MAERRRGDEVVTHGELRQTLQPIFDLKGRAEPWLRFFEAMRVLGLEELLPELLKDERTRQVLQTASRGNWARWTRIALVAGVLASVAMVGDLAISLVLLLRH